MSGGPTRSRDRMRTLNFAGCRAATSARGESLRRVTESVAFLLIEWVPPKGTQFQR
jgi:hypothetical protein